MFYALALPEIASSMSRFRLKDLQSSAALEQFARKARSASSWFEAVRLGAETLHTIIRPDCVTTVSVREASGSATGFAVGPGERYWSRLHDEVVLEKHLPLKRGTVGVGEYVPLVEQVAGLTLVIVPLVQMGSERVAYDYRCRLRQWAEFNGRLRERSCCATPLFDGDIFRGVLSARWSEPRAFRSSEVDVVEKISSIIESTLH